MTANVRTWGFAPFPTNERLAVRFVPSSAGTAGASVFPAREEKVIPEIDGSISVNLAQTTNVVPNVWFTVRFEWFDLHPITSEWNLVGWSDLPGKLRVPSGGGRISDYIDTPPPQGAIMHGYGEPPDSLKGVMYIDRSGVKPVLYVPPGGMI